MNRIVKIVMLLAMTISCETDVIAQSTLLSAIRGEVPERDSTNIEYSRKAMNESEIKFLKERAAMKVAMLNDYIKFMADKSDTEKNRLTYRKMALGLFIAGGGSYIKNGMEVDGVVMEVTSTNRSKPRRRLMRDYFTGLINLKYQQVEIRSTDVAKIKVSDLKEIGDGLYECTCYFDQYFRGKRGDGNDYIDLTRKKVTCRIRKWQTPEGDEYEVLLGDVTALSTKRLYE